jgi:hypothetical protein
MGIQVVWDNPEKTIIRQTFDAIWTWSDFYAAKYRVDSMMNGVGQPVGLIFEMPPDVLMPPNVLSHGKNYIDTRHPSLYMIVISGTNIILESLFTIFRKIYPSTAERIEMVATIEEARAFLIKIYPAQGS